MLLLLLLLLPNTARATERCTWGQTRSCVPSRHLTRSPSQSLRAHPRPRLLSPRCSLNSSTTFTRKKIKDWMPAAMRMITCMELSSVPELALPLAAME